MGKLDRISKIGIWPRWIGAAEAAIYCGVSESTFYSRVQDKSYPQGFQDGDLVQWDRHELDDAKLALKNKVKIATGQDKVGKAIDKWTPGSSAP